MKKTRTRASHFLSLWKWNALAVTICFVFTTVFGSVPNAFAVEALPATGNPIPAAFGKVDETFTGSSGKKIIYIQDAHDSLEAQEHIAGLISHLVEHSGVKTVYEEGYEGEVPTDHFFKFIQDPAVKQKVSYFLLDKLRIGGAEYAHINRKNNFELIGADSIPLQLENIARYQETAAHKTEMDKDLLSIYREIEKLAQRFFSPHLKQWLALKKKYDENQLSFIDYARRLETLDPAMSKDRARDYPTLRLLISVADTHSVKLAARLKSVDARTLFEELAKMENSFAFAELKSPRDKKIFRYYRAVSLLRRLSDIRLVPAEYDAAKNLLKKLSTGKMARFIADENKKTAVLSKRWERSLQSAVRFYEVSRLRDRAIETQIDRFIHDAKQPTAVLVFGGFHKNNIKQILRAKGVSYEIVSPKISAADEKHHDYYKQLMSVGYHAFEMPAHVATAARNASIFLEATQTGVAPAASELRAIAEVVAANPSLEQPGLHSAIEKTLAARSEKREPSEGYVLERYLGENLKAIRLHLHLDASYDRLYDARHQRTVPYVRGYSSVPGVTQGTAGLLTYIRIGPWRFIDHRIKPFVEPLLSGPYERYKKKIIYLYEMQGSLTNFEDDLVEYVGPTVMAINTLDLKGRRTLDLGSGEGILSLVAFRKGAVPVLLDYDEEHRAALERHLEVNGIDPKLFRFVNADINKREELLAKLGDLSFVAVFANIGEHPYIYPRGTHLNAIRLLGSLKDVRFYVLGGYCLGLDTMDGTTGKVAKHQDKAFAEALAMLKQFGFDEMPAHFHHQQLFAGKIPAEERETTVVLQKRSEARNETPQEIIRKSIRDKKLRMRIDSRAFPRAEWMLPQSDNFEEAFRTVREHLLKLPALFETLKQTVVLDPSEPYASEAAEAIVRDWRFLNLAPLCQFVSEMWEDLQRSPHALTDEEADEFIKTLREIYHWHIRFSLFLKKPHDVFVIPEAGMTQDDISEAEMQFSDIFNLRNYIFETVFPAVMATGRPSARAFVLETFEARQYEMGMAEMVKLAELITQHYENSDDEAMADVLLEILRKYPGENSVMRAVMVGLTNFVKVPKARRFLFEYLRVPKNFIETLGLCYAVDYLIQEMPLEEIPDWFKKQIWYLMQGEPGDFALYDLTHAKAIRQLKKRLTKIHRFLEYREGGSMLGQYETEDFILRPVRSPRELSILKSHKFQGPEQPRGPMAFTPWFGRNYVLIEKSSGRMLGAVTWKLTRKKNSQNPHYVLLKLRALAGLERRRQVYETILAGMVKILGNHGDSFPVHLTVSQHEFDFQHGGPLDLAGIPLETLIYPRQRSEARAPADFAGYLEELTHDPASPIFIEEVLRTKPIAEAERQKIHKLAAIFNREIENGGSDRHLLRILEASLKRIDDPELAESVTTLIQIFRQIRPDVGLDKQAILTNPAYQALIWLTRSWPKRDLHAHVSSSIHTDQLVTMIAQNQRTLRSFFEKEAEKIEESESGRKDTIIYALTQYYLAKPGPWVNSAETRRDVANIFKEYRKESGSRDFILRSNDDFAQVVRHVIRQYFEDGVHEVHFEFNPIKRYSPSVDATLQLVHVVIAAEEQDADRRFGGRHRVYFTFSFNREKNDPHEVSRALDEIGKLKQSNVPYAARMKAFDLSGPETRDGRYARLQEAWQEVIAKAERIGLQFKMHLGDRLNTNLPIEDHLEFVLESFALSERIENLGHGIVLSPSVETKDGFHVPNPAMAAVEKILALLRERKMGIETAPSDLIWDAGRERFRIFYWREKGISFYPVVDGFIYRNSTLSQWLVRILLAAPEQEKNIAPLTVGELKKIVSPETNSRSEARVEMEIPGPGPGQSVKLNVPEDVKKDFDQVQEWDGKLHEVIERLRNLIGDEGAESSIEDNIFKRRNPHFIMWAIEHFSEIAMGLSPEQLEPFESHLMVAPWILSKALDTFNPLNTERYEFWGWFAWMVRMLAVRSKLLGEPGDIPQHIREDHLMLLHNLCIHIPKMLLIRYQMGSFLANPREWLEEKFGELLLRLKRANPLHPLIDVLVHFILPQEDENTEQMLEEGITLMMHGVLSLIEARDDFQPAAPKKVAREAKEAQALSERLQALQNALTPETRAEQFAWEHPMEYLLELSKPASVVSFDPPIDHNVSVAIEHGELPRSWQFELDWIEAMAKSGYKNLAMSGLEFFIDSNFLFYLHDLRPEYSIRQLVGDLRDYLNLGPKSKVDSLRTFLLLPTVDVPEEVQISLQFWDKLRKIKEANQMELAMFFVDEKTADFDEQKKQFRAWLGARRDQKVMVVGANHVLRYVDINPESVVWIDQMIGRPQYDDEEFFIFYAIPHAVYKIGETYGYGNETRTAGIMVRGNERLMELFSEGAPFADESQYFNNQFQDALGKKSYIHAVVVTSEKGEDGEDREELTTPETPDVVTPESPETVAPETEPAVSFSEVRVPEKVAAEQTLPREEIRASALEELKGRYTVFVDLADFAKFTNAQVREFEVTAYLEKKVSFVFYHDSKQVPEEIRRRLEKMQSELGVGRIVVTAQNGAAVFARYGGNHQSIHIAKNGDRKISAELLRQVPRRGKFRFFRYAGSEVGILSVALLYANFNVERFENLCVDLSMVGERLRSEVREYLASFVIARSA